jgi:hypothetical protein
LSAVRSYPDLEAVPSTHQLRVRLAVVTRDPLNMAEFSAFKITRAVWKVRGLALLLRVGTLWRCGDGLFFEVPPLASVALLTTSSCAVLN